MFSEVGDASEKDLSLISPRNYLYVFLAQSVAKSFFGCFDLRDEYHEELDYD